MIGAVSFDLVTSNKPTTIPPGKSGVFPHPILRSQQIYLDLENTNPETGEIPQKITSNFEMVRFAEDGTFETSGEMRSHTIDRFLSSEMVAKYPSIPDIARGVVTIAFAEAIAAGVI